MAQIPFVRETIETLLIKVKDVLAANNCASAFWQSNLKNKNLHDEEILTQVQLRGENSLVFYQHNRHNEKINFLIFL